MTNPVRMLEGTGHLADEAAVGTGIVDPSGPSGRPVEGFPVAGIALNRVGKVEIPLVVKDQIVRER